MSSRPKRLIFTGQREPDGGWDSEILDKGSVRSPESAAGSDPLAGTKRDIVLGSVRPWWWRQTAVGLNADLSSAVTGAHNLPEENTPPPPRAWCCSVHVGEVEAHSLQKSFLGKMGISHVVPPVLDTTHQPSWLLGRRGKLGRVGKQRTGQCGPESKHQWRERRKK